MMTQEQTFDDREEQRLLTDELSLLPGMADTGCGQLHPVP